MSKRLLKASMFSEKIDVTFAESKLGLRMSQKFEMCGKDWEGFRGGPSGANKRIAQ